MYFSSWSLFKKSNQRFQHQARLTTYSGSVHALAVSNDGQALPCGGTEGIKVWDIKSRKELTCSTHNYESRGTMLFQETCTKRLRSGFEITFGTRDKIVQVLVLNANSQLEPVFAVRLDNIVPKSVAFADDKCVYVFGLYDGNFIKLKGDDGTVVKEYSCQSVIGHAAVNQKRGVFVVDNATNGFTLYRLVGDEEAVRTFVTAPPSVSVPKQVAFGAEGRLVVGGSDNSSVYIFERKSGKLLETLHHSNAGLVQTITTCDIDGRCIVVSASPALGRGRTTINLWVYDYGMKKETLTSKESSSLSHALTSIFITLIHISALLVTLCFLISNYNTMTLSADLTQHMRPIRALFANNLHQSVHEAVFDTALHAHEEVHEKSNILILRELAEMLMEVIREAEGDVGEDVHEESVVGEKDDIAAEAERVFYEALRVRCVDIRGDDSGGKDVILI
ncbi:hypothetical protein F4604DRAFT_1913656 [Suillus subluteus]|nr:hypothetical protein F4604DRAFT_1913656 [Suillus subluteus]